MKKILTLLVIFLATANVILAQTTATAQTPKLTYQIVVRDAYNNLVINQDLMANVSILQKVGADFTETGFNQREISGKTNMNGMLPIVLQDEPIIDPRPDDPATLFQSIDWSSAYIVVEVTNYDIKDTIEVFAVPYALNSIIKDLSLTTPEIVKYGVKINIDEDVKPIFDAYWSNPADIAGYLHDTVVNYIRNQVGAARNLTLYFLQLADADDVQDAYDAVPDDKKQMVAEKIGEKAKNHFDAAKEIAIYHIENATAEDIEGVMNTLKSNENSKLIMAAAVDSVKEYIMTHDSVMAGIVKTVVDVLPLDNTHMNEAWNRVQSNTPFYEAMKAILDTCIYSYLDTVYRAVSDSNCHPVDICQLRDQIQWLRGQRHISCPELLSVKINDTEDQITMSGPFTLSATFTNNKHDVDLEYPGVDYMFVLKYPNTNYPNDTLHSTSYNASTKTYTYHVGTVGDLAKFEGRSVEVTALVSGLRCKALTVSNDTPAIVESAAYECPAFASFTHTSPSLAEELGNNQGVALNAKLFSNYGNVTERGFVIVTAEGNDTLKSTTLTGLTFSDKIDMSYCGQTLTVYAYVKCGETSINSDESTFTLRGVDLEIVASATSWKAGDAAVELQAVNSFRISTPSLVNELGTNTPSVEQIIDYANAHPAYADYLDYLSGVQYAWEFPTVDPNHATAHTTSTVSAAPENATAGSDATYKANFTVTLFGANCSVSATVQIHRDND